MKMAKPTEHGTSLQSAIKHYKQIAKTERGQKAHYALGALEVLERVKALRDEMREDMKRYWADRATEAYHDLYYQTREMVNCLDNLMIEASDGT